MVDVGKITEQDVLKILETVMDPEVPVLSVVDLGIVRKIEIMMLVSRRPLEAWASSLRQPTPAVLQWM
jgi:hypothetical protein